MEYRHTRFQGAIVDEGRLLLVHHHALESGRKYWAMPGGGIEPDESEIDCVKREMREETGLEVEVQSLLLDLINPPGRVYHRQKTFLCRPTGGTAAPGEEPEAAHFAITDLTWLDLNDPDSWRGMFTGREWVIPVIWEVRTALRLSNEWPVGVERLAPAPAPSATPASGGTLIRPAEPEDRRSWECLMRAARGSHPHRPEESLGDEFVHGQMAGGLLLADGGGEVLGSAALTEAHPARFREIPWQTHPAQLILHQITVSPEHRRRGLARAILEAAEARAAVLGYQSLRAEVPHANAAARALFEGRGYRVAGAIRNGSMESVFYELPISQRS